MGLISSNDFYSPPHIITSLAYFAPISPPETGASIEKIPAFKAYS